MHKVNSFEADRPVLRTRVVPWMALSGAAGALASYAVASLPWISAHVHPAVALIGLMVFSTSVVAAAAVGYRLGRRDIHAEREAEPDAVLHPPADSAEIRRGSDIDLVRHVLDSLSDGFTLWDADDRLVMYNESMGFEREGSRGSLEGIPFEKYARAMFRTMSQQTSGTDVEEWVTRRMAWHREARGTHEILMASGRWIQMTERRTPSGATIGLYSDITERKNAEERLLQSERRLTHAQKLARVGIWEWDAESRSMYWSDILYEIVGLPPESPPLSQEQYYLLVHPSNRDIVRSTYNRLFSVGGQYNQEYQIIRPDGEVRTLRTEAEAILDETGRPLRILGAVHDLTELKRAERAMRKALQAADEANRAKSEFLANVSHELRTPLNAIIGFSEVMTQEVFGPLGSERYRDYASDIRHSGTHLLGIINDLLDYAKLESGHLELHIEPVAVGTAIDNSLRLVRDRADEARVALVANPSGPTLHIDADNRKVVQILLNLLSNAIKFTPSGGVVTITAQPAGDGIEIQVTDTGIGMSEKEIEIAMSAFGQVDSSFNRQHTGTGLGLPLSRALAELHGGRLDLESAPGRGTTVRLFLPNHARNPKERNRQHPLRLVMGGQAS